MLKLLSRKGKDNKGFTLIELIVVIAIIAILALLLVPRFAGFTDSARVANDNAACETIEKAFMTLVANQTIKATGDVIITIPKAGDWEVDDGTKISPAIGVIKTAVQKLTDTNIQAPSHSKFTVTIKDEGEDITVTVS